MGALVTNKYFLALLHLAVFEPMIQHLPSLFQNAKSIFNIFLDALQISRKVTFKGRVVRFRVQANWCWPLQISIIADQVRTSFWFNVSVGIIIILHWIGKQPIKSDGTNVIIVLDNVLVIATSKLRSIDCHNTAIKICEALECKGWIPLFSLCMVVIASWTMAHFTWTTSMELTQPGNPAAL